MNLGTDAYKSESVVVAQETNALLGNSEIKDGIGFDLKKFVKLKLKFWFQ